MWLPHPYIYYNDSWLTHHPTMRIDKNWDHHQVTPHYLPALVSQRNQNISQAVAWSKQPSSTPINPCPWVMMFSIWNTVTFGFFSKQYVLYLLWAGLDPIADTNRLTYSSLLEFSTVDLAADKHCFVICGPGIWFLLNWCCGVLIHRDGIFEEMGQPNIICAVCWTPARLSPLSPPHKPQSRDGTISTQKIDSVLLGCRTHILHGTFLFIYCKLLIEEYLWDIYEETMFWVNCL